MSRPPWYEMYLAACLSTLWVGFWPPAVWLLRRGRGRSQNRDSGLE